MGAQAIEFAFLCDQDCQSNGCPGHTALLYNDNTSDTTSIVIPDKGIDIILEDGLWQSLIWADRNLYPGDERPENVRWHAGRQQADPVRSRYHEMTRKTA